MHLKGILIVANAVERLKIGQLFTKYKNISLVEEFDTAVEATEFLTYHTVDFIVLKTNLPVYDGFDFIHNLKYDIPVILIAAKAEDALKAYEMGLIDCLPALFDTKRLALSIDRLRKRINKEQPLLPLETSSILVRCNLKNEKILLDTILWIEAMGDYIKIITQTKKYIILSTMKEFMDRLPENQFFRIHKSYIVNVRKVDRYTAHEVEIAGKSLPLSRTRKSDFQVLYTLH